MLIYSVYDLLIGRDYGESIPMRFPNLAIDSKQFCFLKNAQKMR